jgi:hypothetical protein
MPTGIEATIPVTDSTSVTRRPPQSRVSTTVRPPRSSPIAAITTPTPANVARLTVSARQPVRMPPFSMNSRIDTTPAVAAKSSHSGWPDARV